MQSKCCLGHSSELVERCKTNLTLQSRGTANKLRLLVPSALRALAAPHFHVKRQRTPYERIRRVHRRSSRSRIT
jgi:hypothetical protein